MGEVHTSRAIERLGFANVCRKRAMPHSLGPHKHALALRILERPRRSPVKTSGQDMTFGLAVIDRVKPWAAILVIADAKPNEDLVAPDPDPMVGGPAAEATGLKIDRSMGRDSGFCGEPAAHGEKGQKC
jgi:hypothetical protein